MTQRHPSPREGSATGRRKRPLPTSESPSASTDAKNPNLQDASAKEYFASPSGRLLACDATTNTDKPIAETRTRAEKDKMLRQTGHTNRGLEFHQRTQAQMSVGSGKRYPANPIRTIVLLYLF